MWSSRKRLTNQGGYRRRVYIPALEVTELFALAGKRGLVYKNNDLRDSEIPEPERIRRPF
jgi:hypothetical protein